MRHHPLSRVTNIIFAFLLAVLSVNLTGVLSLNAAHAAPANNGTLKVHELGTTSGTESNDPKVCAFNFEGFSFDPSQDGYIIIETQPGGVSSLVPSPLPFGPTDNSGYTATAYINNGGTYTLANGQYKATLYGKDTGNPANPDLTNEKAKSKVFKVDCTDVTPAAPTKNDVCGIASDTYTIPTTAGVDYQINGQTVAAGTYPGTGTVTITAVAQTGYTLTGTTTWTFVFDATPCPVPVTPAEPTHTDMCGTDEDTYFIPTTDHVSYQINGQTVAAGEHVGSGSVTINAVADPGYVLAGTITWTFTFTDVACDTDTPVTPTPPTHVDMCGTEDDTYTIPTTAGVDYQINGQTVAAGTYPGTGTVTITAVAQDGYVLNDVTSEWTFTFTDEDCPTEPCEPSLLTLSQVLKSDRVADEDCQPGQGGAGGEEPTPPATPSTPVVVKPASVVTELPETGPDQLRQLLTILISGITAYGLAYLITNRRDFATKK
jgi:hypothetical protein